MNEQNESEQAAPPIICSTAPAESARPELKPFSYWAKRFLVCNPFYLVSAALLLFGMCRLSVDRSLFVHEIPQLIFNLSSLEFYGIFGSLFVALTVGVVFSRDDAAAFQWAVQSGFVFALLHSLRWADSKHEGARVEANATALWMPCIPGGVVLAAYLITQFLRGRWDRFILPAASILTVLSGPGQYLAAWLHFAPAGLLAIIGSFVLFALGTAAALTKHLWHKNPA